MVDRLKIAETIAKMCYYPKKSKEEQAAAYFIEKIVLPSELEGYDDIIMTAHIMNYLRKNNINFDDCQDWD